MIKHLSHQYSRVCVLVISSDCSFARLIGSIVEKFIGRCEIHLARNDYEAIRKITRHQPQLLVFDGDTAEKDDQPSLCDHIRNFNALVDMKTLYMRRSLPDHLRKRFYIKGFMDAISRPFKVQDFVAKVKALLKK